MKPGGAEYMKKLLTSGDMLGSVKPGLRIEAIGDPPPILPENNTSLGASGHVNTSPRWNYFDSIQTNLTRLPRGTAKSLASGADSAASVGEIAGLIPDIIQTLRPPSLGTAPQNGFALGFALVRAGAIASQTFFSPVGHRRCVSP